MRSFDQLDLEARRQTIRALQKIAKLEHIAIPEAPMTCPVMKEELRLPCGLTKCRFWVDKEWVNNCALQYLTIHKLESLTIDQLSFLFGITPDRIDTIYRRCFKIVQRNYLRSILQEHEVVQFNFIPGICVACESRIDPETLRNPDLRASEEMGYCSEECRKAYDPQIFEIEHFFGTKLNNVLKVGIKSFSFHYLEEMLGFRQNALRKLVEREKIPVKLPIAKKGRRQRLPGLAR